MGQKYKFNDRTGEINYNNRGSRMEIIKYTNALNMIIRFDNGYTVECAYGDFKKGKPKSPYEITLYGIGYIGEGKYKTSIDNKHTVEYSRWKSLLMRCYSKNFQEKRPTYRSCTVCEEWLCFQTFAQWYNDNYYKVNNEKMCLDKDILYKGNKIYSPETCIFVPNRINALFEKCDKSRGDTPIGVSYNKKESMYGSYCDYVEDGKSKMMFLGFYDTPVKAHKVYKSFKEKHIKEVANDYKDKIPKRLYNAMMNYIVEIND